MADILGFACRFPESNSATEFWTNLMNGVDMVTADNRKWPIGYLGLPPRFGKVPGLEKFDATFFKAHGKQAQKMDPQMRKLLEVSYEAWMDTGVDFRALRSSDRVGVYMGACGSDAHAAFLNDLSSVTGYEQTGCAASMLANRVSWFYDFRGPSKTMDTACSSSLVAFNEGLADMASGRIDYAVVGGASTSFSPGTSLAFQRLQMLSPDGHCKSFDASANGYTRADGVAVVILSRVNPGPAAAPQWLGRAPYGTVLACASNNDGYTKQGVTFPSGPQQCALAKEVCKKAGVHPSDVCYVEAHGTGTVAGDGQELSALAEYYGKEGNRSAENPLLIGSVKSNMGHCEGCSGMAALIKVLLSFENGLLPANLHFKEPNPQSEALKNGMLKVVTEHTPVPGTRAALSNFGFGGTNVHAIVEAPKIEAAKAPKKLANGVKQADLQAFVGALPLSSHTRKGIEELAERIKNLPGGVDTVAAPLCSLANSLGADLSQRGVRGLLLKNGELRAAQGPGAAAPVWFAFTGNGSQWTGMGRELLEASPIFRASISSSAAVLKKEAKFDLLDAFDHEEGWNDPLAGALGLTAIQIALVDLLKEEYGITPAGVLGHSAGEIACAYADGGFTARQALMTAYHRGRMCPDHKISGGLMAAIGLGAADAQAFLDEHNKDGGCVVACDNSPVSTTLSGPAKELRPLLKILKANETFVREVDTKGMAYHSPVLTPTIPALTRSLEKLIPSPTPRSETWLTTVFPEGSEDPEAPLCSAGYQVAGFATRVQFRQACMQLPENALVLEVGPHALLRSAIRQNRTDVNYVALMRRGEDASVTVPAAVGELWMKGASVAWTPPADVDHISELPRVIREALVAWDYSTDYPVPSYKDYGGGGAATFTKTYRLGKEHAFLADHIVDGRILMPATSYLVTAWEALANEADMEMGNMAVQFSNVSIIQAVSVQAGEDVTLSVQLDKSHRFQVIHNTDLIAEGTIRKVENTHAPLAAVDAAESAGAAQEDSAGSAQSPTEQLATGEPATVVPATEEPATKETAAEEQSASDKQALPEGEATGAEAAPERVPAVVEWQHGLQQTVEALHFYLGVSRAGITYGPKFQMVLKATTDGFSGVLRWDECYIRFLDGALQAGAFIGLADFQLRIPTRIRSLTIKVPKPDLLAGSEVLVNVDPVLETVDCDLCTVTGVELSLAPQRPANYRAVLSGPVFVPYGETVDTDAERVAYLKPLRGVIGQYIKAAIDETYPDHDTTPDHLQKIKALLEAEAQTPLEGEQKEEVTEEWLDAPNHQMARMVFDLFSTPEARAKTMENPIQAIVTHPQHGTLYSEDLYASGFHRRFFAQLLEVVVENQSQFGFRAAEIGAGTGGLTRQVMPLLEKSKCSEMTKYVATDVTPSFGPNLLKSINSPKLDFKVWDINKDPDVDALGGPFNLIMASNAVHTCNDMAGTLGRVYDLLEPGGFVLFFEITGPLAAYIWGLDERTWTFTDEREYGLWMAKPRWHRILAEAGFQQIREHWCPSGGSALFLYRKPMTAGIPVPLAVPPLQATPEAIDAWIADYNEKMNVIAPQKPKAEEGTPEQTDAEGATDTQQPKPDVGTPEETAVELVTEPETEAEPEAPQEKPTGRLWLTGDLHTNPGVLGMGRCLRHEANGDIVRWAMDFSHPSSSLAIAAPGPLKPGMSANAMVAQAAKLDLVSNVFVNGVHGNLIYQDYEAAELNRAAAETIAPQHGVHLDMSAVGDLTSFYWKHCLPTPAVPDMIPCTVTYGSLNFRDVMLAYGKLSKDLMKHKTGGTTIGLEFAGVVEATGQRVMGLSAQPCIATRVVSASKGLWEVPAEWSLAQAATVPCAYATAYNALVVRGRLSKHHRVLIHSATGAVGLAATRIALHRGCEVFVTCGTAAKRAFLLEAFPLLDDAHIGDSRSCSFEALIKRQTKGGGVHLALNSLADDKLQATVRCLADAGRLLEIGKYDILKDTPLGMRPLLRNIAFEGIDLDRIMNDPALTDEAHATQALLAEGVRSGEVVPLPLTVFPKASVANAFRFMAAGTHMGKVLVQMASHLPKQPTSTKTAFQWPAVPSPEVESKEGDADSAKPMAAPAAPPAMPTFFCRPDRSYVITGGLGGFGLALADWLVKHGAKHLLLTSKRGLRNGSQAKSLAMLREQGVQVEVTTLDVAELADTVAIVAAAAKMAPLGGVFHLAMILRDKWLSNQTGEDWNMVVGGKAVGALNLDRACDGVRTLEHFVVFSSMVASLGNEGQSPYAYANTAAEMVCYSRKAVGLPALAIQWGVIDNVGYVAETLKGGKVGGRLSEYCVAQPVDSCLDALKTLLVASATKGMPAVMRSHAEDNSDGKDGDEDALGLVETVLNLLGLKEDAVGENDNLAALGIDSMQLMEVRMVLQKRLCRPVPVDSIGTLTVASLRKLEASIGGPPSGSKKAPTKAVEPEEEEATPAQTPAPTPAAAPAPVPGAAPVLPPAVAQQESSEKVATPPDACSSDDDTKLTQIRHQLNKKMNGEKVEAVPVTRKKPPADSSPSVTPSKPQALETDSQRTSSDDSLPPKTPSPRSFARKNSAPSPITPAASRELSRCFDATGSSTPVEAELVALAAVTEQAAAVPNTSKPASWNLIAFSLIVAIICAAAVAAVSLDANGATMLQSMVLLLFVILAAAAGHVHGMVSANDAR